LKTPKAIALILAFLAMVMLPAAAMAQGKKKAEPLPPVTAAAREAGKKAAPAIIQKMNLSCQISDAREVGKNPATKTSLYEVACGPGAMGYIVQVVGAEPPVAFSCLEANSPPVMCQLPGNANPQALLGPFLARAKVDCVPVSARGIGQAGGKVYLEAQCQGGSGYIVGASAPLDVSTTPLAVQDCFLYDDADAGQLKCTLVDQAARLATVDSLIKQGASSCVVKERRFAAETRDGTKYFEASCQDGKGYVFKVDTKGQLVDTIDCVKAASLLDGGCKLTDTRQAQTEQAALYTRLAKSAGSNCDVDRYALFPPHAGEEDVELVCKDGSGAIGIFRAGAGPSQVLDCPRAQMFGFACSLSKAANFAALNADLKRIKPDTTCVVSDSRVLGKSSKGTVLLEVACADKLKGYVLEYQTAPTLSAVAATGCALAGGCKLPGNT